jgi:hypothetical protein
MSTKILLQTILKLQDQIKTGAANFMDVSAEYFKSTGNFLDDSQKAVALEEINKIAPSNVTTLEGVDPRETILPTRGPNVQKAGEISDTPFTDTVRAENPDVEIRGDETFSELMEKMRTADQKDMAKEKGIGSLFPKDKSGYGFDDRGEAATFIKAMRDAGIKNEDIRKVFKDNPPYRKSRAAFGVTDNMVLDLEPGKKAATTLARAADMKANTKIKQELLADLDDDIANYGPDWWKGMGYNEGPMGRESVGNLLESMTTSINNGVIDDLIAQGVDEDKAFEIMRSISRDRLKFDPKGFVRKTVEELEFNDIEYDMSFWDNYVDEILTRIQKPAPRFADGGLV